MRQHYDAAYSLQSAGDLAGADIQHRAFLAAALHHVANGRANSGEYKQAVSIFDQALELDEANVSIRLDYAKAALDAEDPAKSKALAKGALDLTPEGAKSHNSKVSLVLGQALWASGEHVAAIEQFKSAAAIEPDFENIYALGNAYLSLADKEHGAAVFAEIFAKFGDTAVMRMNAGRAYAIANYFPEAIQEFKLALAKDSSLAGLHYSLGASYMARSGVSGYPQAEAEFRKELYLHPGDTFSYPPLGTIAIARHDYSGAETDLKRAVARTPGNPDTLIALGQLYVEMERSSDAESAFRRAIAATNDPSRNQYAVHTAHYDLGRLLIKDGDAAAGKKEIDIAQELLAESNKQDGASLTGKPPIQMPLTTTHVASAQELAEDHAYERTAAPLIAASFNNLGVHAAMRADYSAAAAYFEHAAQWNPSLGGLDSNWGHAALAAKMYGQAVGPLGRCLLAHPADVGLRSALGISQYMAHDYGSAVHTIEPIETQAEGDPLLALAYADSMVKTGDFKRGMERLVALESANPDNAMVHYALGAGYAENGNHRDAARELHTAVLLDPVNTEAQYLLATSLNMLGQTGESEAVLAKLVDASSTDVRVYIQLGQLRLERGDVNAAVRLLETAERLSPQDGPIHLALAEAYHRASRPADARREAGLCQVMLAFHPPGNFPRYDRNGGLGDQSGLSGLSSRRP